MAELDDALALRRSVGAVALERDVVRASGPDTVTFLQGQLSQDVSILAEGGSAFSLLLSPQGKVDALVRVTRVRAEEYLLDTDAGFGEAVVTRLQRFKLRTKCDLEPLAWSCVAVRGPASVELLAPPAGVWSVLAETPQVPGFDLLGPEVALPEGVPVVSPAAYEALRIELGVPRMGAELDVRTIPEEAGVVARSVSFTKGCYTGQELVARIDSRGSNVPRRLRGIVIAGDALPPVGASLLVGAAEVGTLTSVGRSAIRGATVALAYVRRSVDLPAAAVVRWPEGEATAAVEELPLVGAGWDGTAP